MNAIANIGGVKPALLRRHKPIEETCMSKSIAKNPAQKRKRNSKQKNQKANPDDKEEIITDELIEKTYKYIDRVILPRGFAEMARRMGHRSIKAKDFRCGCMPSIHDGLPVCTKQKPDCRFANRKLPDEELKDQMLDVATECAKFKNSDYFKLFLKIARSCKPNEGLQKL